MASVRIGIIGGSGVGDLLDGIGASRAETVPTPFGLPSSPMRFGTVGGQDVVLIQRHGEGHRVNPSAVPYRANIHALKQLGVTHVLATAAVGSLTEAYAPRHLVVPDQVIDKTFRRETSFFGPLAVHTDFSQPFCPGLRALLLEQAASSTTVHPSGTYVCMEGPQFSSRAESLMHRAWGGNLIGMTLMPEARLAREAELCYAAVALVTDYDSWRPVEHHDGEALSATILGNLKAASEQGLALLRSAVGNFGALKRGCSCGSALEAAVWTAKSHWADAAKKDLSLLLGKYL